MARPRNRLAAAVVVIVITQRRLVTILPFAERVHSPKAVIIQFLTFGVIVTGPLNSGARSHTALWLSLSALQL